MDFFPEDWEFDDMIHNPFSRYNHFDRDFPRFPHRFGPHAVARRDDFHPGEGEIVERREQQLFRPRCEVGEYENEFIVRAELPGIPKDKVKVDYDGARNVLSLEGTNEEQREESKEGVGFKSHFSERRYGSFRREFKLPEECRERIAEITARSTDGILEVHCPKTQV